MQYIIIKQIEVEADSADDALVNQSKGQVTSITARPKPPDPLAIAPAQTAQARGAQ